MPMIIASAVITTGRSRVRPAARRRRARPALAQLFVGESDMQDAVGGRDADAHDRAHHRPTLKVVCVRNSIHTMPANAPGKRRDDDERISPRLEIHDHQQINERGGEDETEAQLLNALFMLSTWPRTLIVFPGGSFGRNSFTIFGPDRRRGRDPRLAHWRKCRTPVARWCG